MPTPSSTSRDPIADAADHLSEVLQQMGDALVRVDATALLAVEGELSSALAAVAAAARVAGDRTQGRASVTRALTAFRRCQRLGASFSGVSRSLARIARGTTGYDRAGSYVESAARSSLLVRA